MNDAFTTLTNALKIPPLDEDEVAAVRHLQTEWNHWREREQHIMPRRIAEEQEEAFTAFVESPTPEREYQLMLLADANLTGTRYALLRKAFTALRGRISAQAPSDNDSAEALAARFTAITDPRAQTAFWRSLTAEQRAAILKA